MATKRGNNEGSITQRADGLWEARLSLGAGKRKSFYAKTRQEAARKLVAALRDHDRGILVLGDGQALAMYLATWLDTTKTAIRPRTWTRYEQYVRLHIVPVLGHLELSKLTAQHVQALYANRLEAGLSTTSVHHVHAVLHKALDAAVRLDLIARNVCDLVDPPRMRHHEMTTLSEEQARLLLATAAGDRFEALYVLALATGMRQGELLALTWRDVDFDHGTLQVRATLQRTAAGLVFAPPKTALSRRCIALSQRAAEALRQHRLRQAVEREQVGAAWHDLDLVFPTATGGPIEGTNFSRQSFAALLARAGLPRMRFHDLRHTAATVLLGRGINPKIVSELLGHARITITLELYSHVTPHMQQQAADAMDAALGT